VTAIAQELDRKLKTWRPATAKKVAKLVEEIIQLADRQPIAPKPQSKTKSNRKADPLFSDSAIFEGDVPPDSARNHDRYLYDDKT